MGDRGDGCTHSGQARPPAFLSWQAFCRKAAARELPSTAERSIGRDEKLRGN